MIPVICNGQRLFYWDAMSKGGIPVIGDDIVEGSLKYRVQNRVWNGDDLLLYVSQI